MSPPTGPVATENSKEGESEKKAREILAAISELRDAYTKLERALSGGPASFHFRVLGDYISGLFSLGKFKIGDRIELAHDIDCNNKPGWRGSAHSLKAGATAVVEDIDFGKGEFSYGVVFDNETWWNDIDKKKPPRAEPVSMKHQYWFSDANLIGARRR